MGVWLLAVQPAAIPVAYVTARRHRRRGGAHPIRAALGGWVTGCLLGALAACLFANLIGEPVAFFALSYLPLWLLAWFLHRTETTAGFTSARAVEDTPPTMDG
ncbi:hypothetical protein [Micromonospora sp. MA102]|uniref:hypothetical protein n=1 Tax=Micromonospora sp. MA102 TaxID=2952755 RepID=UPI0021C674DA|nr:hypothetical protein [Micromonospora sp. MA102]